VQTSRWVKIAASFILRPHPRGQLKSPSSGAKLDML
jgi:hypothetical protein